MAQTYNLNGLEDTFKKMLTDKKKANLKSLQFILEMNRQVGFDEILIREGFESYTNKSQLDKNKTFKPFELFFKYMVDNHDSIQQIYLRQSNDKELIEKTSKQDKKQFNFLLNKNSISKFIRDEAIHYQKVLDLYLQDTGSEQKGIKSTKMHLFFIELFKNKYISIIKNNSSLLDSSSEQISVYIGNILLNYAQKAKDMTSSQTFNEFVINEEEILDFLTFWLKQEVENSLFVLYARTRQRLEQQSKILINKSTVKAQIHPSRMTKQQINEIQKAQQENPLMEQKDEIQNINSVDNIQMKTIPNNQRIKTQQNNINSLQLTKSKVEVNHQDQVKIQIKKQVNKEQILQKELKGLFEFGCKRRYKLNKNTTFDQLQTQSKTMDLEKFMNFCSYFQLTTLINKQLLFQYFKMQAINLRIINFDRFEQIIKKVIKIDLKIVDNLLNKPKYDHKHRQNQIKRNKRLENKLSTYQFKLMPVNGKDVSTIQKELEYRKLQKQIEKEEKEQRALFKRQQLQTSKVGTLRSKSNLSQHKISTIELQSIRDSAFNPEKLIQSNANDHLWNIYQAKIWKKQQKPQKSILQTLLSKRISRGTDIIKKINSQRSFLTE